MTAAAECRVRRGSRSGAASCPPGCPAAMSSQLGKGAALEASASPPLAASPGTLLGRERAHLASGTMSHRPPPSRGSKEQRNAPGASSWRQGGGSAAAATPGQAVCTRHFPHSPSYHTLPTPQMGEQAGGVTVDQGGQVGARQSGAQGTPGHRSGWPTGRRGKWP